eukprot:TRINITY_DN9818_c1_g1_i1.p1 TRINITY_DN9818_c1_g1~~TRINITY_DN9818_c1_g1_i1.p1  ORF type:complete len:1001 (-),score=171.80 TRINITY_DN9818_c1_g1_i1:205-3207(-)
MPGSPPMGRPQADCAGAGYSFGDTAAEEKTMESGGKELPLPPGKQRKERLRAETDALKTALREHRLWLRQLQDAEEAVSLSSFPLQESSSSSFCSRARDPRETSRDGCVSAEDVVRWCQLRQALNCHQEAVESEHAVWQACLAQQGDEEKQVQQRLIQAEESQQKIEARIQYLMDIMVSLLSPTETDAARQELVQEQYAAMVKDLEGAYWRLQEQVSTLQATLEAERSENCRRALQLSDQQLRTKRLHDALCQLQSELFRPRTGHRARKQPGERPEDPVVRSSTLLPAANGSGRSAQEPAAPCLVLAESSTVAASAPPVISASLRAVGALNSSSEVQDNGRDKMDGADDFKSADAVASLQDTGRDEGVEKASEFKGAGAVPTGSASATLSLGSESDPPPAWAHSTSRTPPLPGAAREGPLEDRSERQACKQLANRADDGICRPEEAPTPNTPQVASSDRLRLLENLLRDMLEELSFEHIVTRLSHGYYEFGKSPALARAHLCLEGGKQLVASMDGLEYEPFKDFIAKLQELECHSSAMSREDMAASASSASEALCGAMMDPTWTAAAQGGKSGSDLQAGEPGTSAKSSRTQRPVVARSDRRVAVDRFGQNRDRTSGACAGAAENSVQKGNSTSSSSLARSPQAASVRGRSPRGKAQAVAGGGNTARAGEQGNGRVMSPTPVNSRRTRAGVTSGGGTQSTLTKSRADKKGLGPTTPVRGGASPPRNASGEQLSPGAGGGCPAPLSRSPSSNAGISVVAAPGGGGSLVLSNSCLSGSASTSQGGQSLTASPGKPVPGSPCPVTSFPKGTSACFSPPRSARIVAEARAQSPTISRAFTPRAMTPRTASATLPTTPSHRAQVCTATTGTAMPGRSTPFGPATTLLGASLQEGQTVPGASMVWVATRGRETSGVATEPRRFVSPPPGVSLRRTAATPVPSLATTLSAPSVPSILAPNNWHVTGVAPPLSAMMTRAASASPARPSQSPPASVAGNWSFNGWRPAAC